MKKEALIKELEKLKDGTDIFLFQEGGCSCDSGRVYEISEVLDVKDTDDEFTVLSFRK